MKFFVGLHQPHDACHFDRCFISVNRLQYRLGSFQVQDWIMDSGAFSILSSCRQYPHSTDSYVYQVLRWAKIGNLLAAVSQDYMCEPYILNLTGLTVQQHQQLTIQRYDSIKAGVGKATYVLPVLQGYAPQDYVTHLKSYGSRLKLGQWVGVGSVCKRNGTPASVWAVLNAIKQKRPDLRLHGFGLKTTSLLYPPVRELLETADSMAWSFHARKQGRDQNSWLEAKAFSDHICQM